MNDWSRFKENQLPLIEAFYNELNLSAINEYDYAHAQRVWKAFGMNNLGDYHDPYLKTDVLLLGQCLQNIQKNLLRTLWPRSYPLLDFSQIGMASLPEDDRG